MILNAKFNLDSFSNWIEEFLPDYNRDVRKVEIPNGFSDAKFITTLGESSLGVRVFVIETIKDPSGRKVGLAKDSFNLIKNYGTPNALIAYYSESAENWRFSLLTSTPSWNEGKIITKLSNPKRHSYVLGPNAKVNTPSKFLINKNKILDFNDLKSRFSLEVVNKEFYKEISESFTKLVGGTRGEGRNKKTYESVLKLPSTNDHSLPSIEFAVRLIGRVIFCWFLREKISKSGNSLMPKELLSLDTISKNTDYYHKILEPIFFEVLNKPIKSRKDNYGSGSFSQIPYLNGGLFSPHDDDFFSYNEGKQAQFHNTVVVPDDWFKDFFSILETYNFTIDENTSIDEDLSIDPEMLGRIFENLLAEINPETGETARKSSGSYYTPRVIVDYMVDESLLLYLKQKTNIDEEKLKAIISYDLSDDSSYPLSDDEKRRIVDAIENVKILDPACGSGAYPIGALQKIVFVLQQTDPDGQIWFHKQLKNTSPEIRRVIEREFAHKNFDYIRKLGIIRENIYGIDIQPIATEISRLRCFLTLVVDERIDDSLENRGVEPLPNLDFKFVTANSLIGLPTSNRKNQMGLFEDTEGIDELREIRDMFFNSYGNEREQLKLQFVQAQNRMFQKLISENRRGHAELTTMLTTWNPFGHKASSWFDAEWMFGIKEGFHIVIANPPYVRADNEDFKELRALIKESKYYETLYERWDLFVPFIEKGLKLLNDEGLLCYITSNSLLTSKFGYKILEYIQDNYNTQFLDYFSDNTKVFDAGVIPVVFAVSKLPVRNVVIKTAHEGNFNNVVLKEEIPYYEFKKLGKNAFKTKHTEYRIGIPNISLGEICYISYGLRPNSDERFWKGEFKRKDLVSETKDEIHCKPYLEGKNLRDYKIDKILYLEWNTERIPKKLVRPTFKELYEVPKLLRGTMVGGTYDDTGIVCNHSIVVFARYIDLKNVNNKSIANSITKFLDTPRIELEKISTKFNLKYLLAILNSDFSNKYLNSIRRHRLENYFYPDDYRKLPIGIITLEQQDEFVKVVDKILNITKSIDYLKNPKLRNEVDELKSQINKMVNDLYNGV